MTWANLTPEQKHVLAEAVDEIDLRALLNAWRPPWVEADLPAVISRLGRAVLELVDQGMLEVFPSGADLEAPPLSREDLAMVLDNPRAWWNGDDALEAVVWLVLTDSGEAVLNRAPANELYRYET